MLKLTIEKAEGGYILSWDEEIEDNVFRESKKVVFAPDDIDDSGEREGMKNLLFAVAEYFGISYDKWSSENLRISFDRKGHKKE
jgi:hypothetical protein